MIFHIQIINIDSYIRTYWRMNNHNTNNSVSQAAEAAKTSKTDYSNPYVRIQSKFTPNSTISSGTATATFNRLSSLINDEKAND